MRFSVGICLASGAAMLLILKYIVFGLDYWNATLHKGRIEDPALKRFKKPLLGLLKF